MAEEKEIVSTETVNQTMTILDEAKLIKVTNQEQCDKAVEIGTAAKDLKKVIDDNYQPHIKAANSLHKGLLATCKQHTAPLDSAMKLLKGMIYTFQQEQKRIRAEKERQALEAAQEAARIDRERLEKEALKAAEENNEEKFEEKIEEKKTVREENYQPVPAPAPKMKGAHTRENWQFEVTGLLVLIKAVAEGKAPIGCLKADGVYLGRVAKMDKEQSRIPGVKFWDKGSVVL